MGLFTKADPDNADEDLRSALRHLPQICSQRIEAGKWCVLAKGHGGACDG